MKMSSNAIRGIRRKKSTISEVKIAVLGATGVGKSGESRFFASLLVLGLAILDPLILHRGSVHNQCTEFLAELSSLGLMREP